MVDTQLIAHDREVYDIAWGGGGAGVFASVSADGSVRVFDLRRAAGPLQGPLHRFPQLLTWHDAGTRSTARSSTSQASLTCRCCAWAGISRTPAIWPRWSWTAPRCDAAALLHVDQGRPEPVRAAVQAVILDIRFPTLPVAELQRHQAPVNALAWAPHSSCHICTAGDDAQALIWDLTTMAKPLEQSLGELNGWLLELPHHRAETLACRPYSGLPGRSGGQPAAVVRGAPRLGGHLLRQPHADPAGLRLHCARAVQWSLGLSSGAQALWPLFQRACCVLPCFAGLSAARHCVWLLELFPPSFRQQLRRTAAYRDTREVTDRRSDRQRIATMLRAQLLSSKQPEP